MITTIEILVFMWLTSFLAQRKKNTNYLEVCAGWFVYIVSELCERSEIACQRRNLAVAAVNP